MRGKLDARIRLLQTASSRPRADTATCCRHNTLGQPHEWSLIETQVTFLCWCALHAETHQRECGGSAVSQKHSVITPAVADPPHSLQQAQHQGQTSVRLFSRSNRANGRSTIPQDH
jgi:hypothetical protein